MSDAIIIAASSAAIVLLAVAFIFARRHGRRNREALLREVNNAIKDVTDGPIHVPHGEHRVLDISRFFSTWVVTIGIGDDVAVRVTVKGLGGHRFEYQQAELLKARDDPGAEADRDA
jgi:hypothetical protein